MNELIGVLVVFFAIQFGRWAERTKHEVKYKFSYSCPECKFQTKTNDSEIFETITQYHIENHFVKGTHE